MLRVCTFLSIVLLLAACGTDSEQSVTTERGKYLVTIMGCNDCHTAGYTAAAGRVPESDWLKGDVLGWRGPWGTTYGASLRDLVQGMSEAEWIDYASTMTARPPMPWFALNELRENDSRSMYRYIKSLGTGGVPVPEYVPPGQEPDPPFVQFPAPPL